MKKLFLLGIISLLLPFGVDALSGSVNLSCSSTSLIAGTTTNCTLSGSSSEGVSALSAKLSSSGGVTISNISTSSIWQGDGSGGSIDLYTDSNKSGNFNIATFTVSASSEGSISVGGVTFSDADFNESSISGKTVNIKIKAEEVKDTTNNTNNTTNNSDSNTNNNTNNNANTNVNNNNTNANNNPNSNLNEVVEEEKKSNDCSLKSLTLSNGNINFSSNITDYVVEVSNDVESIDISAEVNDSSATIDYPSNLLLEVGDNKFSVVVTAEDGTKKIYNVNVIKLEEVLSNDSSLVSLNIDGYDIDFSSDNFVYDLGDIKSSSLVVDAVSSNDRANIKIYGKDSIGKNDVIVIEVTAEDGSISEYIIYVNNIKSNINWLMIIVFVLLVVSLVFNAILIYKIKGKNNKKNNNDEEKIIIDDNI